MVRTFWREIVESFKSTSEDEERHIWTTDCDKISTGLVGCEHVKAKIGKALRADGSPCVWKKFPPARGQKGFLS